MKTRIAIAALLVMGGCTATEKDEQDDGWISLFDGHSLEGWKASENSSSCRVEDGAIVVGGLRSHLFYVGEVQNAMFYDFEFSVEVMTRPGSNSGIYIHTRYQEEGWPSYGYEAQVNNTSGDVRRTGSLYGIDDVHEVPARDNEWFTYHVTVRGKRIVLKVNGAVTVDYTEPENVQRPNQPNRKLMGGTFAFQAHDPQSTVYYRNIRVKPLPRDAGG